MVLEKKERREAPAYARIMALMCVSQSHLEDFHEGVPPITRTGDYSDVVVVDADGRRIPWPEVSHLNQDEMRDLMREVVNKIHIFLVKAEDPDFQAFRDFVRPATSNWDKPKLDNVMMHHVEVYASTGGKGRRSAPSDEAPLTPTSGETPQSSKGDKKAKTHHPNPPLETSTPNGSTANLDEPIIR